MAEKTLSGVLLDEHLQVSLTEISQACSITTDWVVSLVEEGILEPRDRSGGEWRFPGTCISTVRTARRLQDDLGLNLAGVALVLELMEEVETLRSRLRTQAPTGDLRGEE